MHFTEYRKWSCSRVQFRKSYNDLYKNASETAFLSLQEWRKIVLSCPSFSLEVNNLLFPFIFPGGMCLNDLVLHISCLFTILLREEQGNRGVSRCKLPLCLHDNRHDSRSVSPLLWSTLGLLYLIVWPHFYKSVDWTAFHSIMTDGIIMPFSPLLYVI